MSHPPTPAPDAGAPASPPLPEGPTFKHLQVTPWPLASLTPHSRHYRRHPASQLEVLARSLRYHGQQKPVVISPQGIILSGHALVEAARAEGWTQIACQVYWGPSSNAFFLMDNHSTQLAEEDQDELAALASRLAQQGHFYLTGYNQEDLNGFYERVRARKGASAPEESEQQLEARLRLVPDSLRAYERQLWEQRQARRAASATAVPAAPSAPSSERPPAAPEPPAAPTPAPVPTSTPPPVPTPTPEAPAESVSPRALPSAAPPPPAVLASARPAAVETPAQGANEEPSCAPPRWERAAGESPRAFAAFECYRSLPPQARSLQRAWAEHWRRPANPRRDQPPGKPHGQWTRWMQQWHWVARAAAWDEEMAARLREQEAQHTLAQEAAQREAERRRSLQLTSKPQRATSNKKERDLQCARERA